MNPFKIAKLEKNITIKKSLEYGLPLRKLNTFFANENDDGFENALQFIYNLIENVSGFFNTREKMTGRQTVQVALAIMERWPNENIEDIILAFKNVKMGLTDKVFGRVDGEAIMGWIEEYLHKKIDEQDKVHDMRKKNMMEINEKILMLDESGHCDPDKKLEWIRKIKESFENPKPERQESGFPKTRDHWFDGMFKNIRKYSIEQLITAKNDLFTTEILQEPAENWNKPENDKLPPNIEQQKTIRYKQFIENEIQYRINKICDEVAARIEKMTPQELRGEEQKWIQKNIHANGAYELVIETIEIEKKARNI